MVVTGFRTGRRFLNWLGRLGRVLSHPWDLYFLMLLACYLFRIALCLRVSDDSVRRCLKLRARFLPLQPWPSQWQRLRRMLPLILAVVPVARKNRCLVASVLAFNYLQEWRLRRSTLGPVPFEKIVFFLGHRKDLAHQDSKRHSFHAWIEMDRERFDLQPHVSYRPLVSWAVDSRTMNSKRTSHP